MYYHGISFDQKLIGNFCQRYGISKLSLFGSILRHDFRAESDIDVLVAFSGATPSLLDLGGMQVGLTALLGREVDLKTAGFLSKYSRDRVMREARTQYVA
jgi:uncharacterized protein